MLEPRAEVALTAAQSLQLEAVTRTASALSAVGVIVIITVFIRSPHFRNPMHRLIFINAFYNAFDVTCTMMSVSGPKAGNASPLCQFQAFLNQMFPVADVLWTLAMAIDVYLIVFRRYDTASLRRLEWKYVAIITTVTFIPAFVMLFIRTEEKGMMYGSVTLWCAIAPKWVLFRIVIYYVPIWAGILTTMVLYILVGAEILKRRRALQSVNSAAAVLLDDTLPSDNVPDTTYHSSAVAMTIEYDVQSLPGHVPASRSMDESFNSTSKYSVSTDRVMQGTSPSGAKSTLSFRQYVLMPLFFFLALLSVWVTPTTNRVAAFVDPTFYSFPLLLGVGTTGSLRGFWNGLVFITLGVKSWKRSKGSDEVILDRYAKGRR